MKYTALVLGFFLLISPGVASAQTQTLSCSAQGYTVVFVNGIFDTKDQAENDRKALQAQLKSQYNNQPLTVQLGYNQTHLAGAGDLAQAGAELFKGSISNFDLDTILMQIYPEVTTRKLMLVGHSQGAFYANDLYDYLLSHGEPDGSVGVYNVASPAAYTAGKGKYINSSGDELLALLRTLNFDVLPNNANLLPTGTNGDLSGHSFVDDYLAQAAPQIQSDISNEMSSLTASDASQNSDCFTPPGQSIGYKTQAVAFAIADPTAVVLKAGTIATVQASTVALKTAYTFAVGAFQMLADAMHITAAPPSEKQTTEDTNTVVNKLYGSSLDGLSEQDKKDLLGSSQGGAVVLSQTNGKGVVLGTSTEASSTTSPQTNPIVLSTPTSTPVTVPLPFVPVIDPDFFNWLPGGGGSTAPVVAAATTDSTDASIADDTVVTTADTVNLSDPSVVINEIEWAGDMFDGEREWIELKNRTASDIDLTGYVIYAADGGSQYIPLQGTLPAKGSNGFFVVERVQNIPLLASSQVQVFSFDQLANGGEQLALAQVTDVGTTTIDMTPALTACSGWCAGSVVAQENQYETLSMERVSADVVGTTASNWASNDTYTTSAHMPPPNPWNANGMSLYATPLEENSIHLPDWGFYCNPDTYPITPGQNYAPQTGTCTVLAKPIAYPGPLSAGVFKGTVGSSTEVGTLPGRWLSGKRATLSVDFSDAQPGDQYFVVEWSPYFDASLGGVGVYTNPMDEIRMPAYFTTGHWLSRDGYGGPFTVDNTDAPPLNYHLIPFTYGQ